jgi:peptidoglycan/xylan/chitin deacetylase (PgdA/CDA1 family)
MDLIDYKNGDRNANKIALTFDDGPNPFWTRKILDVLEKYSIKANFFILGKWAEKHLDIVKEIFNRGHLIGNHSYSHPREDCADFEKAEVIIFRAINMHTRFIRPPYNNVVLCNCYDPAIKGGAKIINNDVIPRDWENKSDEILKLVLKETKNGSIILLHDGSEKEEELKNRPKEMFKVLPNIIIRLKKNFEIIRLDELIF